MTVLKRYAGDVPAGAVSAGRYEMLGYLRF